MTKISIALCTYNGSKYLEEQLCSFVSQVRQPDELIICDDGSSDRTLEILDNFSKNAPFTVNIIVNRSNLGVVKNFENAIRLCNGDLIALSDQDDVWHPDKLKLCERIFSCNSDIGAVFTNAIVTDRSLSALGYDMWHKTAFTSREQKKALNGMVLNVLLKHYIVTGATLVFRADFKQLVLPIPSIWFHDAWIALLMASISKLSFVNEPLMKYRQHSANQLGGVKKNFIKQIKEAFKIERTEYYDLEISRHRIAIDRLFSFSEKFNLNDKITLIEDKLNHLEFRSSMHKNRFLRIPSVFKECTRLGYYRYARNWGSIAMDLLFK